MTIVREIESSSQREIISLKTSEFVTCWFYRSFSFSTQLILLKELGLDNRKRFSSTELRRIIETAKKKNPHLRDAKVVEFDPKKESPVPFATTLITCVEEIGVNGLVYLCRERGAWVLKFTAQARNESRDNALQRMRQGHTPTDQRPHVW